MILGSGQLGTITAQLGATTPKLGGGSPALSAGDQTLILGQKPSLGVPAHPNLGGGPGQW